MQHIDQVEDLRETTLSAERRLIAMINVFSVDPANQDRLVRLLQDAAEHVLRSSPGAISTTIHKSTDGTRVANYAQWKSMEAFEKMMQDPETRKLFSDIHELARPDPHLYWVVSVHISEHNRLRKLQRSSKSG